MDATAFSIDMRSTKDTHPQIIRLTDYVAGEVSESTLAFLQDLCTHYDMALDKITAKCLQLKITLHAKHLDKIVELLHQQHALPQDMLNSIQYFLMDKSTNNLVQSLVSSAKTIDMPLNPNDPLKATQYVLNHLNIYTHTGPEIQFLSTLVFMMIRFYDNDESHGRKRTTEDTIKWIKSLFSISEKSDLSKLIQLLGDHIEMIHTHLSGQVRDMDFIELYGLFENLALKTKHFTPHDSNKTLLLDIHAMMLLALTSKKYPHALFDIVYAQQTEANQGILKQIQSQFSTPLILDNFFNGSQFQTYFRECSIRTNSNQQAFLTTAFTWMKTMTQKEYECMDISAAVNFVKSAHCVSRDMDQPTFLAWLQSELAQPQMLSSVQKALFHALEYEANVMNAQSGSLIFIANKLVAMGFSPKAVSATQTGLFQPLIASNALQISQQNLQSLKQFFQDLNALQQQQLITELCLIVLMPHQTSIHAQAKTKPLQKRTADQHYPVPTLHRIKKAQQARPTNHVVRKQPTTASVTVLFEPPADKIKPVKHAVKYATRH